MSNQNNYPEQIPDQSQETKPGREYKMDPQPVVIREGYKGSEKLKGKVALITGGDSGIGRSVAVHFAREGADVAISYLDEHRDAERTKEMVEAEGMRCVLYPGDISNSGFCKQLIERVVEEFGHLDVLVNNAAYQNSTEGLHEIDDEQLHKTFRTNIFPMFYLCRAALPHLPDNGAIVNSTSVTTYRGSNHLIDYASTKGAIVGFTRSLAKNLADRGLRVNAVAPGPVWTPFIPSTMDNLEEFGQNVPLGRPGQPAELGPAYVFLACADASYVTGQVIHVNGGEVVGG